MRYLWMLRAMLPKHPIWCLTDQDDGVPVYTRKMRSGLTGWWSKLELFAPHMRSLRPFLYLDLDTYVLGDLTDILSWKPDRLAMLADFNDPKRLASGMMVVPDYDDGIWFAFDRDKHTGMAGGDQEFIASVVPDALKLQGHFDGIKSYKVDGPNSGRVVCFHGEPKPHTASEEHHWVRDVWRSNW